MLSLTYYSKISTLVLDILNIEKSQLNKMHLWQNFVKKNKSRRITVKLHGSFRPSGYSLF